MEDAMTKANHKMPELIEKYYKGWIKWPTLLQAHPDRERFYRFVKACIRYSRRNIDTGWLRYFLERDLAKRYSEQYRDEIIAEILILFERILDFNKTSFPDHILEMKNPYAIYGVLRRYGYVDKDGKEKPYYSDAKIEKILRDNFGPSWREDYRRKHGLP